ncbi:MAG TPA: ester cyclase [Trueperaceae bacterium]
MPESTKKTLYRRFVDEVINDGNYDAIPEIFSSAYVDHSAPPGAPQGGFEGIRAVPEMFRAAFPDVHFLIESMVEEGDWVATRVTGTATHLGRPFLGIPPSGRRVAWSSEGFFRVAGDRIVEHYGQPDLLGLREQLATKPEPGSLDENRAIIARYVYEVNMANFDAFDEFVDPDYVDHDPLPGQAPGVSGLKDAYRMFTNAMPDVWFSFQDLIADGDLVVGRGMTTGTHKGSIMGEPPTNRRITWSGTRLFRVRDGKVREGWINLDMLGVMRQAGAIPPLAS